ncbi:MAG: START-like domain-containing protein [Saprospiraceae bacterium]
MERIKFTNEYLFRASPTILYQFLTTPSCLIRWFCDEVDINGSTYSFFWEGSEEVADLVHDSEDELLRFKWEDADDPDEFLEFKIEKSPVTGETILEVTDYCDDDELEDQKALWDSQINKLKTETGG